MSDKQLRAGLIRLAHSHPEFRKDLLPLIKSACDLDEEKMARFEKGKPADPTENMSAEDAAEWERQNELHRDKFKEASKKQAGMAVVRRTTSIAVRILNTKPEPGGQRQFITGQMSIDFGGDVQPDAVRFGAFVSTDKNSNWMVESFVPQKTVSGGGAEILLGVLKAALQEAISTKGAALFGPAL